MARAASRPGHGPEARRPEPISPGTTRLVRAFALAEELHRGQTRKKSLAPVLSHLMAVTALVLEQGGDEDEAIAALLHDGPEDCGGQPVVDRIRQSFGDRVAEIVLGCTDTLESPKPGWLERKQRYIDRLGDASPSTLLVSLADKVHNVRSLVVQYRHVGDRLWNRFTADRDQTLWYYRALLGVFESRMPARCEVLVSELRLALDRIEQLSAPSVP